ncbi:hypothetical protein M0R45_008194 [Rubus argutus]|uniref:BTB domain-containing protein n=1 Tax=Rubus argutus TaxID=59490 RepID=A0AAW1Y0I7_RUBAR
MKQCGQLHGYVAADLETDIIVNVGDSKFHLHTFPLLSKSARLQKLANANESKPVEVYISDIPGGPAAFEICAKFCYGMTVTLNAYNPSHALPLPAMPPSRYPSSLTITMSASHGLTTAPLLTQTKQSPQPSISNTTPVNHLSTLQTKQPTTITDRSPVKNSNPITTSDPRLIPCRPILTTIVLPSSLDSPASIRRQDPVHLQAADEPQTQLHFPRRRSLTDDLCPVHLAAALKKKR